MTNATLFFATVGVIGMAAQWLAWRFRIPAIILLLAAGLLFGPATGLLLPAKVLGSLIRPMVSAAVAVILFEGGLSLDFAGLKDASQAVRRIVFVTAPLMWAMIAVAAHYVALLSWPSAAVIGGILVVTGPTVVQPLLKNARMQPRPAAVLRWEAIVNDPMGALFAVLAYEVFVQTQTGESGIEIGGRLILYIAIAGGIGYALARAISYAYRTTLVPEYLKVPLLFVLVLACFVGGNQLLDEAGLLAVTVMGVQLGNSRIASLTEIRRFKEHAAVLLVSGVFVVLTADIDPRMIADLDLHSAAFAALLLFLIRPVGVVLGTLGTNLTWRETLLISWVAPRGVVAVATAAIFGSALAASGAPDGARIPALVFAIVLVTVILFGLTTVPLARWLKLASSSPPGILIVGSNPWTLALADVFISMEIPVTIADRNWRALKAARDAAIPVYYGEILAEAAEHRLDHAGFGTLIAATESDAYNTLVCTDLGPSFGRQHVFQIGRMQSQELDPNDVALSLGGRTLMKAGFDLDSLLRRLDEGWTFRKTKLTEEFGFDEYRATLAEGDQLIVAVRPNSALSFSTMHAGSRPAAEDTLVAFVEPRETDAEAAASARHDAKTARAKAPLTSSP
jgi:NhaP-type Na+/H+ or K+/H+ antiporter